MKYLQENKMDLMVSSDPLNLDDLNTSEGHDDLTPTVSHDNDLRSTGHINKNDLNLEGQVKVSDSLARGQDEADIQPVGEGHVHKDDLVSTAEGHVMHDLDSPGGHGHVVHALFEDSCDSHDRLIHDEPMLQVQ